MRSRWTVRLGLCVLAAVVAAAPAASAQGTRRVSLTKRDEAAVERAREGAARRLEDAECRKVLTDFHDAQGRMLEQNLEEWAMDPAQYLRIVPFVDGTGEHVCRREDVMLVSTPNVPRVIVCPRFAEVERQRPEAAPVMVIHEVLHTLGLGENPPTSTEITQRVEARCR
jgi:hypothetical protein